jgi:hypothetical protein
MQRRLVSPTPPRRAVKSRRNLLAIGAVLCGAAVFWFIHGLTSPAIQVNETFPLEPNNNRGAMQMVAEEIYKVVQLATRSAPPLNRPKPILCFVVFNDPTLPPMTTFDDHSQIRIRLVEGTPKHAVSERGYSQFTYQLSHELAHVMMDPRRTNGVMETIAVALSHKTLAEMAARWSTNPPAPPVFGAASYAGEFISYSNGEKSKYLSTFPRLVQDAVSGQQWKAVSLYLRYRRDDQDKDSEDRNLNTLGAIRLLSEPIDWESIVGVAAYTPRPLLPAETQVQYVDFDLPHILSNRPKLSDCLRRLGRGCENSFIAAAFDAPVFEQRGFVFDEGNGRWIWLVDFDVPERAQVEAEVANRRGRILKNE